jgi:hypothetical protein
MVWIWYALNHLVGAEREFRDDIVFFSTADIGWISGHHYGVHGPLLNGLTVLWYEDAPDYPHPGIWWELAEAYGATHMLFSPTAVRLLMKYGDEWPRRYDLSRLMALYPTGEVLNEEAYKWLRDVVCGGRPSCQIADIWGQTETACFVTAPGSMNLGGVQIQVRVCGAALPDSEDRDIGRRGEAAPAGAEGARGREAAAAPAFLHSLWGDPDRYVRSYWSRFPGYYHTGDVGYIDEEGHLHILGRSDDVIKVAGHRLSTREVEDLLTSHPAIAEAAVVGIPDPVRGEVLGVFVVPKDGAKITEEEVAAHLKRALGPVAVVGKIAILSRLPKTRTGKVMRRVLRAVAAGQPAGRPQHDRGRGERGGAQESRGGELDPSALLTASLWRGLCHATYFPTPSSGSLSGGGASTQKLGSLPCRLWTTRFLSTSLSRSPSGASTVQSTSGSSRAFSSQPLHLDKSGELSSFPLINISTTLSTSHPASYSWPSSLGFPPVHLQTSSNGGLWPGIWSYSCLKPSFDIFHIG